MRTSANWPATARKRRAERAACARSTVAEALKALEFAGVLTWQNRITLIRERCADLLGHEGWRWRVIRTFNAYVFRDPKPSVDPRPSSKSDQRTGTLDQEIPIPLQAPAVDPNSLLERALARLEATITAREAPV